jgi:hypothetical protein
MRTRHAFALLANLGLGAGAAAQPQTQGTVTYTLTWSEFHQGSNGWINAVAGNGLGGLAGVVDSGEGALFRITMSMSGTAAGDGSGTPLTWDPTILISSSGVGTLSGFWSGDVDLVGDGGATSAAGTWSDDSTNYAIAARRRLLNFTESGNSGAVTSGGAHLTDIRPMQFGVVAANLNHSNNVVVFQGLWIPASYALHVVNWSVTLGSLGFLSAIAARDLEYDNGFTLPVVLNRETLFGSGVTFQVGPLPAPGSLGLIFLSGVAAARRPRRTVRFA